MKYITTYNSPLGLINITSDGEYLTGLYFDKSSDSNKFKENYATKELKIFDETKNWLDIYFSGKTPTITPKYKIENLTPFRKQVIDILNTIPYGKTITYKDIAKIVAKEKGIEKMSSQAVGNAVGWNPICIIIPCHRVIGTNESITGYGGGIKNKIGLLEIEKNDISSIIIPKKGNKL